MSSDMPGGAVPNQGQPMQQAPRKSSNAKWLIPLILVIMGIPMLCCVGCMFFGVGLGMMTKPPWDAAVNAAKSDPQVQEKLGTPIETGMRFQSNVSNNTADVGADLSGPNGTATLSGSMVKSGETWSPQSLTITYDDASTSTIP